MANFFTAVLMRFDQDAYSVAEAEGSLEICVLLVGRLRRNVDISIQVTSSTATGL